MLAIISQLAPIFVYFLVGVLLKRFGLADRSHGDFVLRLAFFVTLPLLILLTLSNVGIGPSQALLPVANIVVNFLCFGAMLLVTRPLRLARPTQGSMAMNTMIANNAFMFPFVLAVYGDSGFADAVLFDFGNAIMVATITYAVAFRYSDETYHPFVMAQRILKGPIFWALAIGVALSLTGTAIPPAAAAVVTPLAQMTSPLILIALGIFFSFSLDHIRLVGIAVAIRMGLGFLFGLAFAWIVGFEGQTFVIVALCSGAPIGFMALTFTSLAKLDMETTTSAVSLSILIGLVYTPLLMWLLG